MGKVINKNINLKYFNKIALNIYNAILDIIYPPEEKCIVCGIDGFIGLCPQCKNSIKRATKKENSLSYGFYGGVIKNLILKFKYENNFTAGNLLSNFLIEMVKEQDINADIICYVPMTKASEKKRGYNQCRLMARNLSNDINVPISNCLKKIKDTREQKTLTKEERMINVKGAFKVINSKDIKNKNIILIDDVMTTGATTEECRNILKKSGAKKIIVLTIAKSNI